MIRCLYSLTESWTIVKFSFLTAGKTKVTIRALPPLIASTNDDDIACSGLGPAMAQSTLITWVKCLSLCSKSGYHIAFLLFWWRCCWMLAYCLFVSNYTQTLNTGRFSPKGVAGVRTQFYWRPSYPLAIIFKTLWERLSTTEASSQCLLGCTMQPVSEADINLSFHDECRLI